MKLKLLFMFLFISIIFGSGGYDHGTSAGKGNWDISLTWNPFNYFYHGQSYAVLGYGITEKLDIHGYYSAVNNGANNYYGGLSYQFHNSKNLDLSTAIGIRSYKNDNRQHLFIPQLLYTIKVSDRISVGGSMVNIKNKNKNLGMAKDVCLMIKVYENKKYKINFTAGGFNPVLWEPKSGDWYPTYSLDIKIKK